MKISIEGVENINEMLKTLDREVRANLLNIALQNAAKQILKRAEDNIWNHQRTGRIYRSLGVIGKVDKQSLVKEITVGARTSGKYKGQLAHLLNNGTKQRSYTTKNGTVKNTGKMPGINFWNDANADSETDIQKELTDKIVDNMSKVLAKYERRLK